MSVSQRRIEILAPAGNEKTLSAAVFSGADCVYLGLQGFNARRSAENFDEEGLYKAVAFCHARNCKVYVTLNTLVFAGRENAFAVALHTAYQAGCDAAIVQDLAAVPIAKQVAPSLALHASTQMGVHTLAGVQKLAKLGFTRAILARELREEEIAYIAKRAPIEVEIFVHGALCLSMSGQCYFSSFLGGRSGNRGACAAPCRLPFCKEGSDRKKEQYALSLKDLSVLKALPKLEEMGVACAKIEGRLRTPEYVAAVVDAALCAREGKAYDEVFLQAVFSRGSFTDGWYGGKIGCEMFGFRGEAEKEQTKTALPKARELYRRERMRVPVDMHLTLNGDGAYLYVSDGKNKVEHGLKEQLSVAQQAQDLMKSLQKTGGTPFFLRDLQVCNEEGVFAPTSLINNLRRTALHNLLLLRERSSEQKTVSAEYRAPLINRPTTRRIKAYHARFSKVALMPQEALTQCELLIFPLQEAINVPEEIRSRTRLSLPRFIDAKQEAEVKRAVCQAAELGFWGFEIHGIGQWELCEGKRIAGGFGLPVTNAQTATFLHEQGFQSLTVSPELSLAQEATLAQGCEISLGLEMLVYGHFPLMITRACPLRRTQEDCVNCKREGYVRDRKGKQFRLSCEEGIRTLHNPVPLWMGDRLRECLADKGIFYFTNETKQEAARVLSMFSQHRAAETAFTRGLYDRATQS